MPAGAAPNAGAQAARNVGVPAAAEALGLPEALKNPPTRASKNLRGGFRDGLLYIAFAISFWGGLSS